MNNKKFKVSRYIAIFIVMLIAMCTNTYAASIDDLGAKAGTKDFWSLDASKMIGAKYTLGNYRNKHQYCLAERYANKSAGNKIVNIIDVNNYDSKNKKGDIVIYSAAHKNGVTYSLNNKNVDPILYLASLAKKAENETGVSLKGGRGLNKHAMIYPFANSTWKTKLSNLGISSGMFHGTCSTYHASNQINQAKNEVSKIKNLKFTKNMTDKENKAVTATIKDGKTYIGPYKITKANCNVKEAVVTIGKSTKTITKISTKIGGSAQAISKIGSQKFYLVLDGEVTSVDKVVLKSSPVEMSKARIVLLYASYGQNFIVYKGEKYNKTLEINLPKASVNVGKIVINKTDTNSKKTLQGVGFKVYNESNKRWLAYDKNGKVSWTSFDNATELKTDKNGKVEANNLLLGKYIVYETSIPDSLKGIYELTSTIKIKSLDPKSNKVYTRTAKKIQEVEIKVGSTITVNAKNTKAYSSLEIVKTDSKTGETISGIGFKVYQHGKGWLKADKNNKVTSYVAFDKATEFITGSNGTTTIKKLPVNKKYTIVETSLGKNIDKYELGTFSKIVYTGDGVTQEKLENRTGKIVKEQYQIKASATGKVSVSVTNKPTEYIDLSGKVWQEELQQKGKEMISDNIYNEGTEALIAKIEVVLRDNNGNIVKNADGKECKTNTDYEGTYEFERIQRDQLSNYHIEFTYDGFIYQSITPQNDGENTSKASETDDDRTTLNNEFAEISAISKDGKEKTLSYTREGSTNVRLDNTCKISQPVEGNGKKYVSMDGTSDFYMTAKTSNNKFDLKTYYDILQAKSKEPVKEITNINLGLKVREMSDINVVKDVENVKLSINGFNHIYNYGKKSKEYKEEALDVLNDPELTKEKMEDYFNVGVSFKKERYTEESNSYKQPIYNSDITYTSDDKSKELQTYITYKIKMINETTTLKTQVNSLVDYFDKKYPTEGITAGTSIDEKGEIAGEQWDVTIDTYNDKYNKMILTPKSASKIDSLSATDVYVRFKLSREQVANLLDGKDEVPLDNVVEVNSYTTFDKDGKLYAAIDKDSIPGNADPDNRQDFEDDTDTAPSFKLKAENDRTLSGIVFEDKAITEGVGNVREGNGQYDDGEAGIAGVLVTMTGTNGNSYNATTDDNGKFTITGYVPDNYTISYAWGEDKGGKNVNDYKGTIFKEDAHHDTAWYKDEQTRWSDAMDDHTRREAIDKYNFTNTKTEGYSDEDYKVMISTTPTFGIGIDKNGATDMNITTSSDGNEFVRQDTNSMDFGIIERARQSMSINKKVDTVKITDASGRTLVDAKVDDKGYLTGQIAGVTGGPNLGYIKAEIDNEMIQGATVEIGYSINIANNSEKDYASENYYLYGSSKANENDLIKIKPAAVYDYLDSTMSLDTSKNNGNWETIETSELTGENSKNLTLSEEQYFEAEKTHTNADGTIETVEKWQLNSPKLKEIYTEWYEKEVSTENIRKVKLDNKTILKLDETLDIAPGSSTNKNFYASKVLANSDEIDLGNDAEITEFTRNKNAGRKVDFTTSQLITKGEDVRVTPPTGENRDYTQIIIISLSAVVLLGAGIIFIKKKVLR